MVTVRQKRMQGKKVWLLDESIAHWEENVRAETPNQASVGGDSCALCREYFDKNPVCGRCPVRAASGWAKCRHTPWADASYALIRWRDVYFTSLPSSDEYKYAKAYWIECATKELNFLKAIRPIGADRRYEEHVASQSVHR